MGEEAKRKKYELICKASNEAKDCAVKAVSMAGRVSYKEAHEFCRLQGRRTNRGMFNYQIYNTFVEMGFELQKVENLYQKNGCRYTPKTIGQRLKTGYYIAYVNGHVLPVINGTVFDWTSGRKHRIYEAFKIVKKRK